MSYVTSFIVLLLLSTWGAEAGLGDDSSSDAPSVWQYIVIALSLAFISMTGKVDLTDIADRFSNYSISTPVMVCLQVARIKRRSELMEQGMRPVIHITRSGARVYAPLPILSENELEQIAIVDYGEQSLEEQSCSICLDLFRPKTKVRLLPCRHAFHPICIGVCVWAIFLVGGKLSNLHFLIVVCIFRRSLAYKTFGRVSNVQTILCRLSSSTWSR